MPDILVVGGGFAGMWAALTAAHENIANAAGLSVALVSRSPWLTIRPRLYEAHPATLRAPILPALEALDITFIQGEASAIDASAHRITLRQTGRAHESVAYRRLIVATGSIARPPPIKGCDEYAFSIDDHRAATKFDAHLQRLCAEPETGSNNVFAIVGAGFTGIELACEMRDRIAVHAGEDRAQRARIVLLDKAESVGPELGPGPRSAIMQALATARIELRTKVDIAAIYPDRIAFADSGILATRTAIVTAGQFAPQLPGLERAVRDSSGRLAVADDLRIQGLCDVYAAGDSALARIDDDGRYALMSCQHAMPMGKHAGYNAARGLLGLELRAYRQPAYVTCLSLGRSGAVFTTGWDRDVQKTGSEAGDLKRMVNTQWIYPPAGTHEEIFAAAHIDKRPGR